MSESLIENRAASLVKLAESGDRDASLPILRDFVGATDQHDAKTWDGHIEYQFARYLARCFRLILSEVDPAKALGLKQVLGADGGCDARPRGSSCRVLEATASGPVLRTGKAADFRDHRRRPNSRQRTHIFESDLPQQTPG
jgi:hypothetical protein